eukprot:CAMPEP_0184292842 /NCGR_PEP_ID=MMETSP1049-20130417/4523_1 /TAXON_ID=77928 /ORGANISM="Proteomonas sulcata, Strain CCMP704" /LENGTH=66 /DNA_ID=CAMNT_0026600749 /DNA_START=1002 /DNA_END=1202 /DNA_ORIENTATION=+
MSVSHQAHIENSNDGRYYRQETEVKARNATLSDVPRHVNPILKVLVKNPDPVDNPGSEDNNQPQSP